MEELKRVHLTRFYIAGFGYYEGCIAMENLKIGSKLRLKREPENRYDENAIEIYYEDYKLGYVPKEENEIISKLLDFGLANMFEVRVQQINSEQKHPEQQIRVIVFLVKGKEK